VKVQKGSHTTTLHKGEELFQGKTMKGAKKFKGEKGTDDQLEKREGGQKVESERNGHSLQNDLF